MQRKRRGVRRCRTPLFIRAAVYCGPLCDCWRVFCPAPRRLPPPLRPPLHLPRSGSCHSLVIPSPVPVALAPLGPGPAPAAPTRLRPPRRLPHAPPTPVLVALRAPDPPLRRPPRASSSRSGSSLALLSLKNVASVERNPGLPRRQSDGRNKTAGQTLMKIHFAGWCPIWFNTCNIKSRRTPLTPIASS